MLWDVFISHASEDKADVARPLQQRLEKLGLRVWIDEVQLNLGDSLREKIDEGLALSKYGVVVLSPAFFAKQWPTRELNGLFAREAFDQKAILPVRHGMSVEDVARHSPLLADRIAISTRAGLEEVAQRIYAVAGSHLDLVSRSLERRYQTDFLLPTEHLVSALDAIESLSTEGTCNQLAIVNDAYPNLNWMGTNSSVLIEVLYRLTAPLVEFHQSRYALKRSVFTFSTRARLQFALLESALELWWHDFELATMAPSIEYTPRVEQWRIKRRNNPVRYWWQGLERERFEKAIPYFLDAAVTEGGSQALRKIDDFRDLYRRLYSSGVRKDQEALGLLANALYGFTPRTRPVFWRLLVCWARIYQALLGNSCFDPATMGAAQADHIFAPVEPDRFPYTVPPAHPGLYEPYETTLAATSGFLNMFVLPKLRQYLSLTREDGSDR